MVQPSINTTRYHPRLYTERKKPLKGELAPWKQTLRDRELDDFGISPRTENRGRKASRLPGERRHCKEFLARDFGISPENKNSPRNFN